MGWDMERPPSFSTIGQRAQHAFAAPYYYLSIELCRGPHELVCVSTSYQYTNVMGNFHTLCGNLVLVFGRCFVQLLGMYSLS